MNSEPKNYSLKYVLFKKIFIIFFVHSNRTLILAFLIISKTPDIQIRLENFKSNVLSSQICFSLTGTLEGKCTLLHSAKENIDPNLTFRLKFLKTQF